MRTRRDYFWNVTTKGYPTFFTFIVMFVVCLTMIEAVSKEATYKTATMLSFLYMLFMASSGLLITLLRKYKTDFNTWWTSDYTRLAETDELDEEIDRPLSELGNFITRNVKLYTPSPGIDSMMQQEQQLEEERLLSLS